MIILLSIKKADGNLNQNNINRKDELLCLKQVNYFITLTITEWI
jgi:hypothetical protein